MWRGCKSAKQNKFSRDCYFVIYRACSVASCRVVCVALAGFLLPIFLAAPGSCMSNMPREVGRMGGGGTFFVHFLREGIFLLFLFRAGIVYRSLGNQNPHVHVRVVFFVVAGGLCLVFFPIPERENTSVKS